MRQSKTWKSTMSLSRPTILPLFLLAVSTSAFSGFAHPSPTSLFQLPPASHPPSSPLPLFPAQQRSLNLRRRRLRPLLFHPSAPLHYGAPIGNSASFPRTLYSSRAASVVGDLAWLVLLLFLLGTTGSDYFSAALEELSEEIRLSPAVAGVTLLAFGTGAPDVFSSVAAFMSSDDSSSIGFSSVLGGALFVTTVVTGTVSLSTARECVRIDRMSFLRDVLFLLAAVTLLSVIAYDGVVHLWEAIVFLSLYAVYAVFVSLAEYLQIRRRNQEEPLLQKKDENAVCARQRSSALNFDQYDDAFPCEFEKEDRSAASKFKRYLFLSYKYGIELPLAVPRRLTIPVVEEERWCRPMAVASCTLAPIFIAALWTFEYSNSAKSFWIAAGISTALGTALGLLAFFNTENERPPQRHIWVWLLGSFVMSIAWFYFTATQVVDTLTSLGDSFNMNTTVLGVTILAWGNSIGDFVADLTLAWRPGCQGIQIAIAGCYAGPLFIILAGLGVSLVSACCVSKSATIALSEDASVLYLSAFLAAGLIWALVMLPLKGMRLTKILGFGLLLVYSSFIVGATCYAIGWISL